MWRFAWVARYYDCMRTKVVQELRRIGERPRASELHQNEDQNEDPRYMGFS